MLKTYVSVDLEAQQTDSLGDRSRLLDGGAELNSALDWAVCLGHVEAAKRCLGYGADPGHLFVEEEVRHNAAEDYNTTCLPGEEDELLWPISSEMKALLENWSQVDEG